MITLRNSEAEVSNVSLIGSIIREAIRIYDGDGGGDGINVEEIIREARLQHPGTANPKLVDLVAAIPHSHKKKLAPYFQTKPIRSASGV